MNFTTVTPALITENNIQAGDEINYIEVDIGDADINDISFILTSSNNDYYITQQSNNTFKIMLTDTGVTAINTDYPENITRELTSLKYRLTVKNNKTNDEIFQDLYNNIVRVHDEPPYILHTYLDQLFTENLKDNIRVGLINTTYTSSFSMTGDYFNYFQFDNNTNGTNSGRLLLTSAGVTYFSTLNWDTFETESTLKYKKFNISYLITDIENGLTTESTLDIKIYQGNKELLLPTKNNTELMAEGTGQVIGDVLGKQDVINYKYLATSNLTIDQLKSVFNNNNLYYKTIISNSKKIDQLKENYEKSDDYKDYIYTETIKTFNGDTFNNISLATTELSKNNKDKTFLYNAKHLTEAYAGIAVGESNIGINRITTDYLWTWIKYSMERKIALTVNTIDKKLKFQYNLLQNTVLPKYDNYFNALAKKINKHNALIVQNLNNAGYLDYRLKQASQFLVDHNNRLINIEGLDLTDWDVPDSWNFTDSTLKMKDDNILYSSIGGDTKLYAAGTLKMYNGTDKKELKWDGQELTADNGASGSKMKAETFEGTATKAKYADLAEYYLSDNNYRPGTILQMELSEKENEVSIYNGGSFAGIVSTNPAFIMNTDKESNNKYLCVALIGRVPVNCIDKIKKGMYVYASKLKPGLCIGSYSKRNLDLIGYALEDSKYNKCLIKMG